LKKTLLLADDSPTIQKVINLTFADEGIDVIAVSDGNAAIQQLREMTPDLVMADVHMPGLNGYQICERLRQNAELKNVPVILLVGSFEPFDEEEAKRVGADDFLMKPFQSIRQLVGRVTALLEMDRNGEVQPETGSETESETRSETGMSDAAETYTQEVPAALAEPEPETAPATDISHAPAIGMIEDDDLANFDSEFDKKFPDAAALSSEFIDTASFTRPAEAPPYETNAADATEPEETFVSRVSVAMPESLPGADEYPDESITAEQPERILDEEDVYAPPASLVMPAIEETSESAFVLDLGEMGAADETSARDILDLENGEQQPVEKGIELVTDEPEPVVMAEIPEIPEVAEAPEITAQELHAPAALEAPQYDFRNPDAFDEDADIQESFQGLAPVEETPVPLLEEPMERVIDDAEPGHVSNDQANGFSGVNTAPATVPQEAIDAATQKVLEQISEKVIRELVSGIMPDIKDLIAKEIAKEND
jgi:CheY-like chemotaxis protein